MNKKTGFSMHDATLIHTKWQNRIHDIYLQMKDILLFLREHVKEICWTICVSQMVEYEKKRCGEQCLKSKTIQSRQSKTMQSQQWTIKNTSLYLTKLELPVLED